MDACPLHPIGRPAYIECAAATRWPSLPPAFPLSRTAPAFVLIRETDAPARTGARVGNGAQTAHAAHRAPWARRTPGVSTVGLLGLLLALAPLVGWGAGWPALAGYLPGWPIVPPLTAVALAVAAVGVTVQGRGPTYRTRRLVSAMTGGLLLLGTAVLLYAHGPTAPVDAAALVREWHTAPHRLLELRPSPFALGALGFIGAGLALLAFDGEAAVRGSWIFSAAAAVVALLTAGVPAVDAEVAPLSPPLSLLLLLFASVLLLVRTPRGGWWAPGGAAGVRALRVLLPGTLLVVPALVWLFELLQRAQWVTVAAARPLLATALVVGLSAVAAVAVWRAGEIEEARRDRDERRRQRQLRDRTRQAAQQADRTVRVAADHYRAQLRSVLELSPLPFVAIDRDGAVAYLNAAAASLFGCRIEDAPGRAVWDLWAELEAELRGTLGARVAGTPLRRTLVSERTGRAYELSGQPDESGTALFIRELPTGG